jgi:hypothetical protein
MSQWGLCLNEAPIALYAKAPCLERCTHDMLIYAAADAADEKNNREDYPGRHDRQIAKQSG